MKWDCIWRSVPVPFYFTALPHLSKYLKTYCALKFESFQLISNISSSRVCMPHVEQLLHNPFEPWMSFLEYRSGTKKFLGYTTFTTFWPRTAPRSKWKNGIVIFHRSTLKRLGIEGFWSVLFPYGRICSHPISTTIPFQTIASCHLSRHLFFLCI